MDWDIFFGIRFDRSRKTCGYAESNLIPNQNLQNFF